MNDFYNKFNEFIFGGLEDTLEDVVIDLLQDHNKLLAVAESCTGGMLSSRLINVSGASQVFKEGLITYANEAKMKYLDVKEKTLKKFGAVSPEVAKEMCDNLYEKTDADVTMSITGIAGPNGGSEKKPVGLVYFGINYMGKTTIYRKVFNGNRGMVRLRSVIFALNLIRETLIKNDDTFIKI